MRHVAADQDREAVTVRRLVTIGALVIGLIALLAVVTHPDLDGRP